MGFCTEDRKSEGIVPDMSVAENMMLALMPKLSKSGIIDEKAQRDIVERFIRQLGIKCSGPDQKVRELSGGNQQKVLLGRWLAMNPRLLILDEPTRGIDVGAKGEIQALIKTLADQGLAVLMISSELEEVIEGADRVFVLREGISVAEFDRDQATEDALYVGHGPRQRTCHGGGCTVTDTARQQRLSRPFDPFDFMARYGTLIALVLLILFNLVFTRNFATMQTLNVNLTQVCTIVIVAVGMTLVIATGGIDLSVGSLMAISGALAPMIFLGKIVPIEQYLLWPSRRP